MVLPLCLHKLWHAKIEKSMTLISGAKKHYGQGYNHPSKQKPTYSRFMQASKLVKHFLYPELENLGPATGYIGEIFEIFEQVPFFRDLTCPEMRVLSSYMTCFGARGATTLLREGEEGDYLLLVLTGRIEVSKNVRQAKGGKVFLATVGPGGIVGEMSLIDGSARNAECIAVEPTDFAVLRRADLNSLLAREPKIGSRLLLMLLAEVARRLRDANDRLLPYLALGDIQGLA